MLIQIGRVPIYDNDRTTKYWDFYKSRRWQPCYTRRLLYHLGRFLKNLVFAIVVSVQTELISGDQNGNIRLWDLTANSCSCELVDTSMRSLTVMWDGSLVVAVNNKGTCYVWRLLRGTQGTSDGYGIGCFIYGHTIDNDVLIVTENLHKRDVQEILEKFHPLGLFDRICMSSVDQYMWIHHLLHTFLSGGDFDEDEDDSDTEEEIEMKNEDEEATGKMETATALPVSNGVVSFLSSCLTTVLITGNNQSLGENLAKNMFLGSSNFNSSNGLADVVLGAGDKVLLKVGQWVRRLGRDRGRGRGSNNKSYYDNINSKKHVSNSINSLLTILKSFPS
ncbi:hypothetical protein Lser_V15G18888 [Lactuca serriola]